jgi:hypothetical protein
VRVGVLCANVELTMARHLRTSLLDDDDATRLGASVRRCCCALKHAAKMRDVSCGDEDEQVGRERENAARRAGQTWSRLRR